MYATELTEPSDRECAERVVPGKPNCPPEECRQVDVVLRQRPLAAPALLGEVMDLEARQ
jgi:hypothetical protein